MIWVLIQTHSCDSLRVRVLLRVLLRVGVFNPGSVRFFIPFYLVTDGPTQLFTRNKEEEEEEENVATD